MNVAIQSEAVLRPLVRRPRRMRAALAISVLAVLAVQCITGIASPKLARASARPAPDASWYQLRAPDDVHRTPQGPRGYRYPTGWDSRHC